MRRAPSTTLGPFAASVRAVASPMPLLAPVMRMTLGFDMRLSPGEVSDCVGESLAAGGDSVDTQGLHDDCLILQSMESGH